MTPVGHRHAEDERRLHAVFDGVEHFLGLLTPDGILLDANRASLELIGARREEVAGLPFDRTPWFVDPGHHDKLGAAMREAAAGRTGRFSTVHRTAGGRVIETDLTLTPVLEHGEVAYIVAAGQDVTAQRQAERAREVSEQRLAGILDIAADAIVSIDESQRIVLFNQGAEAVFGYRAEEVLGQRVDILLPEAVRERHETHVLGFSGSPQPSRFMNQRSTITGRRRGGELFPAEATISHLDLGGARLFTAVMRDISERRRAEAELERTRRYTEAILTAVPEGIFGLDRAGRVTFVNPAAIELLGFEAHEFIGRELHGMIHHSHADGSPYPFVECPVWSAIHDGVMSRGDDDVYWRADGRALPVDYTTTPFFVDGDVSGAVVVFRDVSDRKETEAALRSLSWIDELTGLYNRRGFHAQAGHALQQAQRSDTACLLLFIDLDYLKTINDHHGHLAGDRALQEVGELLRSVFRDSDVLARVGGDEFVVLAVGCREPHDEATVRIRLSAGLERRNAQPDVTFPLSVSLGVARFDPAAPVTLEHLIGEADAMLYAEKRRRPATR